MNEQLSEEELCPPELLKGQEEAFARDIERLQARVGEFVAVNCPACHAPSGTPAFEKHTFKYLSCPRCETVYMSPRPSPAVMDSYYSHSENYQYWAQSIFKASENVRREKINRPWLERIISYCDRYGIKTDLLLEIGAGFGTFAELAKESGRFGRVVVVERTPEMAESCRRRGIEVIEKPIEDAADTGLLADVAVAFEVVEHLFDPSEFLHKCFELLKPGGLLVISCPNGKGFDISLLGAISLAVDPEHVNLFNPESLSRLVGEHGFEVLNVSTPGRLDAEFVRMAILEKRFEAPDSFLQKVLIDDWDRLGWPFQQFLAEHGLSSHMWLAARKPTIP